MNPSSEPEGSLSGRIISAGTTALALAILHNADAVSSSWFLQWDIINQSDRAFFAPSNLECIQKHTGRSTCWKLMVTFKPERRPSLFKEFIPDSKFAWMLLWQQVWFCKHKGRKRPFSQSLPLAPHLSKINKLLCFGLAKMLKQITYDTSHGTISEVKPAIFLPEHAEYFNTKIKHLASACSRVRWAPNPLLFYFVCCSCQRAPDLLAVSLLLHRLQLLKTSTQCVHLVWVFSAPFMSFLWCFFVRGTSGILQKFPFYRSSQYLL